MNWLIGILGGFAFFMLWLIITQVAETIGAEKGICISVFLIGGISTWLAWNIYWVEIRK